MDAGVVDQYLDRPVGEQGVQRRAGRLAVGDVECDRHGTAALVVDRRNHFFGAREVGVGVDDHVQAVGGQLHADRATEVAATAGDQRTACCGDIVHPASPCLVAPL